MSVRQGACPRVERSRSGRRLRWRRLWLRDPRATLGNVETKQPVSGFARLWAALWRARLWWLPPIVLALVLLVLLAILKGEGPIAAFVYSLR